MSKPLRALQACKSDLVKEACAMTDPCLLGPHLVFLVVRIGLQFGALPLSSALALTFGGSAVGVLRNLGTCLK